MGSPSAVAGTGGILLTSNFGIPACWHTSLFNWLYTHTTSWYPYHKEASQATELVIRSLATLVCIGKHNAHKIVHAQLMQHGDNNQQKDTSVKDKAQNWVIDTWA
jgi:hypothetical protein